MPTQEEYTERRKALIAALRSGEFKQGRNFLSVDGRMCCLGVACELYRRQTGEGDWECRSASYDGKVFTASGVSNSGVLISPVAQYFGFRSDNGSYRQVDRCGDYPNALSSDNDTGKTFLEIADTIESEPPGLFV